MLIQCAYEVISGMANAVHILAIILLISPFV